MRAMWAFLGSVLATTVATEPAAAVEAYRISGPFTHENLTVFLLHGEAPLGKRKFLTLADALAQKKVIVHETANVNELSIENRSGEEVFVQAGDMLRGGKQDRTLATDLILEPHSGRVPIQAFCVESGRWQPRGQESSERFSASTNTLATKSLKLAARKAKDQGTVWREVAGTQSKLSENLRAEVRSDQSGTSLQLALENGKLEKLVERYMSALKGAPDGKVDAIGFAFAINGKVNSAEVYGSNDLFRSLWPKLLKASAIEAISERNQGATKMATTHEVETLLKAPANAKRTEERKISSRTKSVSQESDGYTVYETHDTRGDEVVHKSFY